MYTAGLLLEYDGNGRFGAINRRHKQLSDFRHGITLLHWSEWRMRGGGDSELPIFLNGHLDHED
jgi:hypothetical protein